MTSGKDKPPRRLRKGKLREKKAMTPVPKVTREVWYSEKPAEIDVPPGYRQKWSDDDTEKVIRATPEDWASYKEFAVAFNPPRTPGGVRWRKAIAIHLLYREQYALQRALSNEHKFHDWAQVHQVLQQCGYYDLPVSEQMKYARHLGMPVASWRGDGTQAVLRERKLNRLDTTAALRELIEQKLEQLEPEEATYSHERKE